MAKKIRETGPFLQIERMPLEMEFLFIKYFDAVLAELFVAKHLLHQIPDAIPGSVKFSQIKLVLQTDRHPDDNRDSLIRNSDVQITFTFQHNSLGNGVSTDELHFFLGCNDLSYRDELRPVGHSDSKLRADYLDYLIGKCYLIPDFFVGYEDETLMLEIAEFIEVAGVNAAEKFREHVRKEQVKHDRWLEQYYETMYDHLPSDTWTREPNLFCERCQESPCQCSDPDPG